MGEGGFAGVEGGFEVGAAHAAAGGRAGLLGEVIGGEAFGFGEGEEFGEGDAGADATVDADLGAECVQGVGTWRGAVRHVWSLGGGEAGVVGWRLVVPEPRCAVIGAQEWVGGRPTWPLVWGVHVAADYSRSKRVLLSGPNQPRWSCWLVVWETP